MRSQAIGIAAFGGWMALLVGFAEWSNRRAGSWQANDWEAALKEPELPVVAPCAEESISLTGDAGMNWPTVGFAIQGKAAVVTCKGEQAQAIVAKRRLLVDELSRTVARQAFGMRAI